MKCLRFTFSLAENVFNLKGPQSCFFLHHSGVVMAVVLDEVRRM